MSPDAVASAAARSHATALVATSADEQLMLPRRAILIRHGETEWTLGGRHTGATDIPLTAKGRAAARLLAPLAVNVPFAKVLTSPLHRARETCELAGLGGQAVVEPDLREWDYGEYEGLTAKEIHARNPRWILFTDGCPGGESPAQVVDRIDRVIARIRSVEGDVVLFAHGHIFRVFAARWLDLSPEAGCRFLLDPGTLSVLSHYRGIPAMKVWNAPLTFDP